MRDADPSAAWFRQPIVWLGALILAATIVACIATVVLAWLHPDEPLPTGTTEVMKVPRGHPPVAASSADHPR